MGSGLELLVLGEDLRTERSPADPGTVGGSCHLLESVLGVLGRFRPAPSGIFARVEVAHC